MPDRSERITSPPGTPAYNRQFRHQALRAADRALALPGVRIFFGVFALITMAFVGRFWLEVRDQNFDLLDHLFMTAYLAAAVVELGNVALRGKSFYLRFLLAGEQRGATETNDSDEAK